MSGVGEVSQTLSNTQAQLRVLLPTGRLRLPLPDPSAVFFVSNAANHLCSSIDLVFPQTDVAPEFEESFWMINRKLGHGNPDNFSPARDHAA